jgi:hypothetical protein
VDQCVRVILSRAQWRCVDVACATVSVTRKHQCQTLRWLDFPLATPTPRTVRTSRRSLRRTSGTPFLSSRPPSLRSLASFKGLASHEWGLGVSSLPNAALGIHAHTFSMACLLGFVNIYTPTKQVDLTRVRSMSSFSPTPSSLSPLLLVRSEEPATCKLLILFTIPVSCFGLRVMTSLLSDVPLETLEEQVRERRAALLQCDPFTKGE